MTHHLYHKINSIFSSLHQHHQHNHRHQHHHRHQQHHRHQHARLGQSQQLLIVQIISIIAIIASLFQDVAGSWWFITDLNVHALGAGAVCDNIPGLVGHQRGLCRHHPDVMIALSRGARHAVDECKHQFRHQRWNCSTMDSDASLFGKAMQRGSREAAFVYAISSAGVAHAITKSCSRGRLSRCACDHRRSWTGRDSKGPFQWSGCSNNIQYGTTFSRLFIDAKENKQRDARALMNLHNNRAGRRAVKKFRKLQCKCHGVSGACSIRTCWLALQPFSKIAAYLKTRYNGATQVRMRQNGASLTVANVNHKRPTRSDLVYLEDSPDYCIPDTKSGSLGTEGRKCNKTSMGTDGCDIMCCGRGYTTSVVKEIYKCECKFDWCCRVHCKECARWVEVHTCNGFPSSFKYKYPNDKNMIRARKVYRRKRNNDNDDDDDDGDDNVVDSANTSH